MDSRGNGTRLPGIRQANRSRDRLRSVPLGRRAAVAIALAGCGSRTPLAVDADGGGAAAAFPCEAIRGPCATWALAPEPPVLAAIEAGPAKRGNQGSPLVADGEAVLVPDTFWCESFGAPCGGKTATWRMRVVTDDLASTSPAAVPLGPAAAAKQASQLFAAARCGRRGAVASDDASGCRFVAVGPDGAAASAPVPIASGRCGPLVPTPDGFAEIVRGAAPAIVRIDASGMPLGEGSLPPLDGGAVRFVRFDDGTFLLLGRAKDYDSLLVRHVGAAGIPLSDEKTIASEKGGFVAFEIVSRGSSAIAAWATSTPCPCPGTGPSSVSVAALDEDGVAGPVERVPATGQIGAVDLAATRDGALVAWLDSTGYFAAGVRADGTMTAPPVAIPVKIPITPEGVWYYPTGIRVVATPHGTVVALETQKQLFLARLVCGPT